MSTRRWLPAILKARQAAEDRAAQQVATSQVLHRDVCDRAALETLRLDSMQQTEPGSAQVFLAAAAAQRAAAATHAAAHHRIVFVERQLLAHIEDLRSAAREHRSAQKLADREAAEAAQLALKVAQRELDDLTVTRWGRDETA